MLLVGPPAGVELHVLLPLLIRHIFRLFLDFFTLFMGRIVHGADCGRRRGHAHSLLGGQLVLDVDYLVVVSDFAEFIA